MTKRKIAYITGTRADFGLMEPVLEAIERESKLNLQLFATGMHLMPEYGNTIHYVRKQFPKTIPIDARFSSGMAEFSGIYIQKLVKVLNKFKPDFILVLGDRVEMLCTALVATYLRIPTAHIHGGEKTSTVDETARHAITKLANLHFPATEKSANRITKLGEEKWRITVVGAPSLDVILNKNLASRNEIFEKLGLDSKKNLILIIQHPVSENINGAGRQMQQTLSAVKSFNLPVVLIYPNSDPGSKEMISVIEKERSIPNFHIFQSLEHKDFLALEKEASVMVGNSSSGMIESSSFKIPVVNVGNRQKGREHGENVINTGYDLEEIKAAIKKSLDKKYVKRLKKIKNPWGDGNAGSRIVKVLNEIKLDGKLLAKQITY